MLTIKVDADAGSDLREVFSHEMRLLAGRTGCRVELRANDTVFWAHPGDGPKEMRQAFDSMFLKSEGRGYVHV